jgi:organic hydroperoxide reductase OsmC/OhrA
MSEYTARIEWRRESDTFIDNDYSRAHLWQFDGGATVPASASPHIVPLPHSEPAGVDPEEAFVASLSSCHMLFFLALAVKRRYLVERYVDNPGGVLEADADGRLAMTHVVLRPQVTFGGDEQPGAEQIDRLHHAAHRQCFIANSVRTEIEIAPVPSDANGAR